MSDDFSLPQLGEHDTDYAAGSIRDAPTTPKTAADLEQLFDVPVMVSAVLGSARMPIGDLLRLDDAVISRWFFLWDGKMNHMGRTSKGKSAPLKKPAELQAGEWTYVKDEDAFYLRLAPGQALDALFDPNRVGHQDVIALSW